MNFTGLYIHIPYCLHKCGYCDFNSHTIDANEMDRYVDALILEMQAVHSQLQYPTVHSIFFGGGTPTTLESGQLQRILDRCRLNFAVTEDCEITLEANPATIAPDYLKNLRQSGFNRISIGVQSFDAGELRQLERVHTIEEISQTVDRARLAGFDNLSLDLMFALPGQSLERWNSNLEQAIALEPEHLSAYNLTIEPGTAFFKLHSKGKLVLPPEDRQLEMFEVTRERLAQANYEAYEISNFARPGKTCRHNINYWEHGDYLGLGAGACSFIGGTRTKNFNLPSRYIQRITETGTAIETSETPDFRLSMGEHMMLGLRQRQGVDLNRFESRFQVACQDVFADPISRLLEKDLIQIENRFLALTPKGLTLADSVILEFIPEPQEKELECESTPC